MKNTSKFLILISFVLAIALLSSCSRLISPMESDLGQQVTDPLINVNPSNNKFSEPEIDEVLVPTYNESENIDHDQYEPPPETIQVQKKKIFLGRTKISKIDMNFNRVTQKMRIKGTVTVLNDKKEELSKQDFILEGLLESGKDKLILRPAVPFATNSENEEVAPVVRGQALCLVQDEKNNRFDCSESIIDLFIAYKGQFFSEQLEIQKKPAPKSDTPVRSNDKRNSELTEKQEVAMNEVGELQSEGQDDSLPGRYEIPTKNANIDEMFSEPKVTEPATTAPKPSAPKPESKPEVKPETKPDSKASDKPASPVSATSGASSEPPMTSVTTDEKGKVRFYNQSIGFPDNGRLSNPSSLLITKSTLGDKAPFEIVFPARDRFYGTQEIADMIVRLGNRLSLTSKNKLTVSDISKKQGGSLGSHVSHQSGVDADLGYPTEQSGTKFPIVVKRSTGQFSSQAYSVAKTYDLLKYAFYQKDIQIARVFVDQKIKNDLCGYAKAKNETTGTHAELVKKMFESLQHVSGHGDHFHLRLKCSDSQPSCRERLYRKVAGCG